MNSLILHVICNREIIKRALSIALVVGIILNLINQGDRFYTFGLAGIHWPKFFMTFCVPFLVSMYTAVSMKMKLRSGDTSPVNTTAYCPHCDTEVELKKDQRMPDCPTCKRDTGWRPKV